MLKHMVMCSFDFVLDACSDALARRLATPGTVRQAVCIHPSKVCGSAAVLPQKGSQLSTPCAITASDQPVGTRRAAATPDAS